MAQTVKNLPAVQETWVRSLGLEDPLKEEMATHSSILAWRIPWTEEPGGLQSTGSQGVVNEAPEHVHVHTSAYFRYPQDNSAWGELPISTSVNGQVSISDTAKITIIRF